MPSVLSPSVTVLQRAVVLAAVAVELSAAFAIWRYDLSPIWLVGWPALLACGYGLVLAAEFAAAARSFARDDPERPSTPDLVRAWWAECTVAPSIFLWSQPFRAARWPDRLGTAASPRGVLLVHGFFCNRGFWNRWQSRLSEAGRPVVAVQLEPMFGPIERYVDAIDRGFERLLLATGRAPVVVGHSMGGIALRAWRAQRSPGSTSPHAMVTIGSPHGGTAIADRARVANGRQMALGSPWLADVAARERQQPRVPTLCVWGPCDNIVYPHRTAVLAGSEQLCLRRTPHGRLAFEPAVYDAVIAWADRPDADQTDRTSASAAAGDTLSNAATSA